MIPAMIPAWQTFATFALSSDACLLSVLCKRSYGWDASGRVFPLEEQAPLSQDVLHARRDDRNGELTVQGRDVWPLKQATDVIVTGHARTLCARPASSLAVAVSVGDVQRNLLALGPRYVERAGSGRVAFSPPELFTEVDVSFWNAYGGIDPFVLPLGLADTPCLAGQPLLELFPGAYPRNPCGLGYLIKETPELLDGLALPLLEQPEQRLTPETLLVGEPEAWGRQPRPAGFGWCHSMWFPRIVQAGGKPYHLPRCAEDGQRLRELELGAIEEAQLRDPAARFLRDRWVQEAAPELIVPFLRGDERVRLQGFDVLGDQSFQLPSERPLVRARVDGAELELLASVIHTLAIDADRKQFYLLRSQRYRVPDGFAGDLCAEEPLEQLLGRCEVSVSGRPLEREQWPAAPAATNEE
jgi:hypothetical protein